MLPRATIQQEVGKTSVYERNNTQAMNAGNFALQLDAQMALRPAWLMNYNSTKRLCLAGKRLGIQDVGLRPRAKH